MKLESIYEVAIYQHKLWAQKMKEARSQQEANEIQCKRLDSFRLSLEAHIYHYLIETYGQQLDDHWRTYTPPKKAEHAFVIVERRSHHNFWFVLRNIAWANPYMSVYIFCSDENIDFVNSLLGDKKEHFNVVQAFTGNASRERGKKEVDKLLTNHKTYDSIDAEYIMTVEMDTFYRKKVLPTIFQGTYWGNPWGWKAEPPGGGGCTIRNIKGVSRVCKRMNPDENKDLTISQDAWLSDTCHDLKEPYPDLPFRANHIMESIPARDPVAVHQFWTYLDSFNITDKEKFISNLNQILTFDI